MLGSQANSSCLIILTYTALSTHFLSHSVKCLLCHSRDSEGKKSQKWKDVLLITHTESVALRISGLLPKSWWQRMRVNLLTVYEPRDYKRGTDATYNSTTHFWQMFYFSVLLEVREVFWPCENLWNLKQVRFLLKYGTASQWHGLGNSSYLLVFALPPRLPRPACPQQIRARPGYLMAEIPPAGPLRVRSTKIISTYYWPNITKQGKGSSDNGV